MAVSVSSSVIPLLSGNKDPVLETKAVNRALLFELILRLSFALVSFGFVYLGYRLFIMGVTGQASISFEANSIKGQLINAAPGIFFAVGGIASLIITIQKGSTVQVNVTPIDHDTSKSTSSEKK